MRFGKEETSTEDKKPCLQGFVPSWSLLTCLRRPYLFSRKRKDRGEKSAWIRLVQPASEFRQLPMFRASFHSGVTLRASDYAPPDTGVSGLQLVAIEYLPSIEGADRICRSAPFCGEIIFICSVLICKIIRHYGNIAIYAKHSTLRYNNPPISKEALALPRWFWYPESS